MCSSMPTRTTRVSSLLVLSAASPFLLAAGAAKPDILFLLLDDFGFNDVQYNNGGPPNTGWTETPNIDRLAARGVRLASYYTNPICSPSRATIMSGRYTIRTGIQHSCYSANQATGLPLSERTLANALADKGYENWALGKW